MSLVAFSKRVIEASNRDKSCERTTGAAKKKGRPIDRAARSGCILVRTQPRSPAGGATGGAWLVPRAVHVEDDWHELVNVIG